MRIDKRVQRVIAGFSGLVLLACQTPSASDPETVQLEPAGYRVFAPGALLGSFPPDPLDMAAETMVESAFGLAVSDSAVFVLDALGDAVFHLDLDGTLAATIGRSGEGPGEFSSPITIEVDGDGNVWVADPQLSRLSKFRLDGTLIAAVPAPHPVVNFMPLRDGSVLIPTLDRGSLVATLDLAGVAKTLTMAEGPLPGAFGGGPMDRLGIGILRLAPLAADTLLLFRNKDAGDFAAWTMTLDLEAGEVASVVQLPLPSWLHKTIEEATSDFLDTVAEEFAAEHRMVAFRSVRTINGTIWLSPNAGEKVILTSLARSPADSVSVIVPNEDEAAEMVDAAVVGDRLVILNATDVRFYELDRVERSRFSPPR